MPALAYIYIASVLIAALSSLISFRLDFPFHLQLFSGLLVMTFGIELASALIIYGYHGPSNVGLYNAFTLLEFWVYGYVFRCEMTTKISKRFLTGFLVFFPIFWAVTVFYLFRFNVWNSYVILVGSFFSVLFALM